MLYYHNSSTNQLPNITNTLTIIGDHVNRIMHNTTIEHLTPINTHTRPKHTSITSMPTTHSKHKNITKKRMPRINNIRINNKIHDKTSLPNTAPP